MKVKLSALRPPTFRSPADWAVPLAGCVALVSVLILVRATSVGYNVSFWPFLLVAPVVIAGRWGGFWGCVAALLGGMELAIVGLSTHDPAITFPVLTVPTFVLTGCAAALGAARLREAQRAQKREAATAAARLRLAAVAGDPSSLPMLLAAATLAVREITGRSLCALFLAEASSPGRFVLSQQAPPPQGAGLLPEHLALETDALAPLARASTSRAPTLATPEEIASCPPLAALVGRSIAAFVPLVNWGRVLGCLVLADHARPNGGPESPFGDQELALARELAGQVAIALENARLYEEIRAQKEQLASHNALLAEQKEQLLALEKQREDLTHMIVHDLRTPLTGIIGGLQTITDTSGEPLPNDMREEMEALALSSANVLLGMVNDLLDVGKMEAGQMALDRSSLELAQVLNAAMAQVRVLAREKGIRLAARFAPDAEPVVADEEKVRRVLVNLLGNALKFTPEGGQITVETQEQKGMTLVRVRDTGEGIPPSEQSRIFDKFGQVESRKGGRKMSTGLGLTFCKLVVEAHGGTIGVESVPGEGSTFWFTLPKHAPGANQGGKCLQP